MFTGSVPKPVVEQIMRLTPFDLWGDVYVCCSGSFRVDRALRARFGPAVRIHSNDVSLLTVSLGKLAMGEFEPFTFVERLEFIENVLGDGCSPDDRVAALIVALEMARFAGKSDHAQAHFRHYQYNFDAFMVKSRELVAKFRAETEIDSFFAGDFRVHASAACGGGGVVAFPPTYKGGYETLYKFITNNTDWPSPPAYDMWNPKDMPAWLEQLEAEEIPFCVFSDILIDGRERAAEYYSDTNKPVYVYSSHHDGSSLRRAGHNADVFKYDPVDPEAISLNSRVQVVPASGRQMNFLKDVYLSKGIHHTTGQFNFLVYVDGMLAGGFIMARSKFGGPEELYMLSDFSLCRARRLAKLIPMIATSRDVITVMERKLMVRVKSVYTTAFTTNPVSMKYRGIFELVKRGDGFLNYKSDIRQQSIEEVYREWWKKHGQKG